MGSLESKLYIANCEPVVKISKKRKRIDAIKKGEQEVTEIDDIIHNSSYRESNSAFLTEFGGL